MGTITVSEDVIERLNKLRKGNESLDDVLKRLIETDEEVEEYIKEKWDKLQRDKDKFLTSSPLGCEDSKRGGLCIFSASLLIGYARGGSAPR